MKRLLVASRTRADIDLPKNLGMYELTVVPPSLFASDGTFYEHINHFDDADVVYDQNYKSSFHKRLESIQYNAALTVTGVLRGSSKKLYQELGLEFIQNIPEIGSENFANSIKF